MEICFLSTVPWHGDFVFTLKPKRIGTPCTNLEEQTGPAPKPSEQTGQSSNISGGEKEEQRHPVTSWRSHRNLLQGRVEFPKSQPTYALEKAVKQEYVLNLAQPFKWCIAPREQEPPLMLSQTPKEHRKENYSLHPIYLITLIFPKSIRPFLVRQSNLQFRSCYKIRHTKPLSPSGCRR